MAKTAWLIYFWLVTTIYSQQTNFLKPLLLFCIHMSKSVFDQCEYVPCVLAEKDPTTITPGGHQCVAQHKAKDVESRDIHIECSKQFK